MANTRSQVLLARLSTLPRLTVPVAALVLLLVGLMARPLFALPALALLVALVGWLASLAWPQADTRGRLVRLVAVVALSAILLARILQASA